MRYRAADNINKLYRQYNHNKRYNSTHDKYEKKIIDQINEKLKDINAVITKADKGNSIVFMSREAYDEKISDFFRNNNFTCTTKYLTTKFQRGLRNVINECSNLIHKDNKWKYVNMNPFPPNIRGLVKIYKQDAPIRPVINWIELPAYKLAKQLVKTL